MRFQEIKLEKRVLRDFGLLMAAVFGGVFGLLIPYWKSKGMVWWPWPLTAFFLFFGLFLPKALGPIYRAWMKIGHVLGKINSTIILGVVYFVLITPMGFLMRLFGKDPLDSKFDPKATTYRKSISDLEQTRRFGAPF